MAKCESSNSHPNKKDYMELTKEEVDALDTYFGETPINITKLIKTMGLKKVKIFESLINKIDKANKNENIPMV